MKFQIKYEVVMMDDNGSLLADAQANLNVTSVEQLVNTVCAAISSVVSTIDSADNNPLETKLGNTQLDQLLRTAGIHSIKN